MALTSGTGSGTSGTFTDGSGQTVSWTSTDAHDYTFANNAASTASSNQGNTYTFDDGSGGGAHGIAVQVGDLNGWGEGYRFIINGETVNLNTLINDGEAQVVSRSDVIAAAGHGSNAPNAMIINSGEIMNSGASDSSGPASEQSTLTVSFNFPITTLELVHLGNPSVGFTDIWVDQNAIVNLVCFTRDTMIATDQGEVAVQDLEAGMMVRTRDNGMQPIRWVGMKPATDRAVRIKAGAMGNTRDLVVSPRHRMVLEGWQLQMLFDHDHALVTAMELINDDTIVRDETADVEYYHVMFDQHEVIFAEGAATESFHPDQETMGSMDAAAREEIFALFPDLRDGNTRTQAAPSLSATQAAYVGKNMDAFVG